MRKRRGRGEGSVYQREDGIWCGSLTVGYDTRGRRKRRTIYGKSKTEALRKLNELQRKTADGMMLEPTRYTVAGYLQRWLETVAKQSLRRSTHVRYVSVVTNHINPHVGGMPLVKLQPQHVQAIYTCMTEAGLS